jgi:hypothetical protein
MSHFRKISGAKQCFRGVAGTCRHHQHEPDWNKSTHVLQMSWFGLDNNAKGQTLLANATRSRTARDPVHARFVIFVPHRTRPNQRPAGCMLLPTARSIGKWERYTELTTQWGAHVNDYSGFVCLGSTDCEQSSLGGFLLNISYNNSAKICPLIIN